MENSSQIGVPILGAIVGTVFLTLAVVTAIVLGKPEQAGILVPLILAFTGPTVVALLSLANSQKAATQAKELANKTEEIHFLVNSRMSKLLELTEQVGKDNVIAALNSLPGTRAVTAEVPDPPLTQIVPFFLGGQDLDLWNKLHR